MQAEDAAGASELYRILGGNCSAGLMYGGGGIDPSFSAGSSSTLYPFEMMSEITDVPQARALAASKNHREAEKRRRERINSHLNKLRSLLPCNSKTDKASLLGKVIEHVKELKQRTAEIEEVEVFPSETDEIAVQSLQTCSSSTSTSGPVLMKASLSCEDRSDLLPELVETLKSLRLKTVRAEMATLGGRIRNVLLVTAADQLDDTNCGEEESIEYLREALKSVIERSNSSASTERSKRRRIIECTPTNSADNCMHHLQI